MGTKEDKEEVSDLASNQGDTALASVGAGGSVVS
jgi:hypothetical protein